jgi:hypothetical protein
MFGFYPERRRARYRLAPPSPLSCHDVYPEGRRVCPGGLRGRSEGSTSERSAAKDPLELKSLAVLPIAGRESPVAVSAPSLPPVTTHQSQITKSCRIRTYGKAVHNPVRIRTSKTRHLKSFRIRTYKKRERGAAIFQPKNLHGRPRGRRCLLTSSLVAWNKCLARTSSQVQR